MRIIPLSIPRAAVVKSGERYLTASFSKMKPILESTEEMIAKAIPSLEMLIVVAAVGSEILRQRPLALLGVALRMTNSSCHPERELSASSRRISLEPTSLPTISTRAKRAKKRRPMPQIIALLILLAASTSLAQDLEAGRRAANRGDFAEALINWAPLAEWGDAEAQFNMGRLLARGDGVMQDYAKAFSYFKKAALQGHRKAAEKLSVMYKHGDGVRRDPVQAEYWERVSRGLEPVTQATPTPFSPPPITLPVATSTPMPTPTPSTVDEAQIIPTQIAEAIELPPTPRYQGSVWSSSSSKFVLEEWILPEDSSFSSGSSSATNSGSSSSTRKLNLVPDDEDY